MRLKIMYYFFFVIKKLKMINSNVLYDLQVLYSVNGNGKKIWNKIINKLNNLKDNSQIINYLKNLIINQPNNELTLDIIDFIISYGNNRVISLIAEKDFMNNFISLLKKEVNANIKIQMKVIYLIQKWAFKFDNDINCIFPIFNECYDYLLNNGIVFPPVDNKMDTYNKYIKDEEIEINNNSQNNKNLDNNLNNISLKSGLTINYNNPFSDKNDEKSFVSDLSIINQFNEEIPNPVSMDNNAFNPYDIHAKNITNNKKNINNQLKNNSNDINNNIVGLKIINDFYKSNINNNEIKNQNKPNTIYNTFVNKVTQDNPFQSYNNQCHYQNNTPSKSIVIPNENLLNNRIYGLKLQEPINEKNKWCYKIQHYNNIIDNERGGGICFNDELKNGMQEFTEALHIINLYISKYSIANDIDTKDMFIKVRNDMEMTLFRYNLLLNKKEVIPFYSAFDGNKIRYDENYYNEKYYQEMKENEGNKIDDIEESKLSIYGNKIKDGIFSFGSAIKEKTLDGYDYIRDKIKGNNKNIYHYDYNNPNSYYYSAIYGENNNKNDNNDNNNQNNNLNNKNDNNNIKKDEENKPSFLNEVKEGFIHLGQSIKNLYNKEETKKP
jgi:hypothetical protein